MFSISLSGGKPTNIRPTKAETAINLFMELPLSRTPIELGT